MLSYKAIMWVHRWVISRLDALVKRQEVKANALEIRRKKIEDKRIGAIAKKVEANHTAYQLKKVNGGCYAKRK